MQKGKVWIRDKYGLMYPAAPNGYGLLFGEYHNHYLIAIDCDTEYACLQTSNLPKTVTWTSGIPSRKQMLYFLPNPITSFKNYDIGIEIRGKGHASVLPPSAHPKTDCYKWIINPQQIDIQLVSPKSILQFKPKRKKIDTSKPIVTKDPISANNVANLLMSIHPLYADN